jgi:hypothetical protein
MKVSFYGVRCTLDDQGALIGDNWLMERLITPAVWLHNALDFICSVFDPGHESKGFPFKVRE